MNDKELMEYEGLGGWARSFVRKGDFAEYAKLRDAGVPKINAFLEMRKLIWLRVAACISAMGTRARAAWPTDTKTDKIVFEDWPLDMAKAKAWLAAKNAKIAARRSSAPAAAPAAPTPSPTPSVSPTPMPTVEAIPVEVEAKVEAEPTPEDKPNEAMVDLVRRTVGFFKDVQFTPQARVMNTLAGKTREEIKNYLHCYFDVTTNEYLSVLEEKMKSAEFAQICDEFKAITPKRRINRRFELMYGVPGGGKTTAAMAANPNSEMMVCHREMGPEDLIRDVQLTDSGAKHVKSALRIAMEEGRTVILDEINLLSLECLRMLQALTDNKPSASITGVHIDIKPGFKIVGTMNLCVDGALCPLPTPLVDRAASIRNVQMDIELLAIAAFN